MPESHPSQITPELFPLIQLEQQHIDAIARRVLGGADNIQDIYPLSPLQEGMLFHHLMNERSDAYVLSTLFELRSAEDVDLLWEALQKVVDRHDVLRSAVLWEGLPRPVQVVLREAVLPRGEVVRQRNLELKEQIDEWMRPGHCRLDLRCAPVLRLEVMYDDSTHLHYALLWVHHVLCDHQSLKVVAAEAATFLTGREGGLPAPVAYKSYVTRALHPTNAEDAERFFRNKLIDIDEPTAPFGIFDVHEDGDDIVEFSGELNAYLAADIRKAACRAGTSPARMFHAACGLVVAHTSAREDVVFGTVVLDAGQRNEQCARMLGMSVNTLPLRLQLADVTVTGLLEQVHEEIRQLLDHEHAPLALTQRCSGISGKAPLFTTILNYRRNTPGLDVDENVVPFVKVLARVEARTNYPITISVDDLGEGFRLTVQTDRRIDPSVVADYLQTVLRSLVDALAAAPKTAALALPVVPEGELHDVTELFNATHAAFPRDKLVHELFEEQVCHAPQAAAAIYGETSISYGELNRKANQLARYLRDQGVVADQVVGICVERSINMVVALLATLKAGGTYLPLDPSYPADRLQAMLDDAQPPLLLADSTMSALSGGRTKIIDLEQALREVEEAFVSNHPVREIGLKAEHGVYVIYTSGSTGRPKGVVMQHRSMVNLIEWQRRELCPNRGQRVLQFAALSFDVAFQEIFTTLCSGGALVLLDEWSRKDPRALTQLLNDQSVERLFVPPMMLQSLAEFCQATNALPACIKDIITAGEQLRISPEIVNLIARLEQCRLHNHYGPTETHVVTALTLTDAASDWPTFPSIGRPIANTQIYILDPRKQPVPIGVAGEIFIGGVNLARGYLGRPELTAEKFPRNPFSSDQNDRFYKTGDLGRWTAEGTIEYLGRNDHQVKIRGYRIEPGEIEAQLAQCPGVREVAVIARELAPGDKRLVAYVTSRDGASLNSELLRNHLSRVLPQHMLPSAFVILDSMPKTSSGKLDRRVLPAPEASAYGDREYHAPQNDMEELVARIWKDLLHTSRVGREDSFFELGGHSLLAMQVVVQVRSALSLDVPIRSLFQYPTLEQFAAWLDDTRQESLMNSLADGDMEELLEQVSALPDSHVRRLMQELSVERGS